MWRSLWVLLVLICGSAGAVSRCSDLDNLGMGELGKVDFWIVPYCTGTAEKVEAQWAKTYPKALFMQSYEVLTDKYGMAVQALLLERFKQAGYKLKGKPDLIYMTTDYTFTKKDHAYRVLLFPKKNDAHLLLIKIK